MAAQARRTKILGRETKYKGLPFGVKGRGCGEATLAIPAAGRVQEVMKKALEMRARDETTSVLFLLPEEYTQSESVKTFLHAYCQQGEVYRYGQLFRRSTSAKYLHLNQPVTEYWFDGQTECLAALTVEERQMLEEVMTEFQDVVGDEFDRAKQPKHVPYVRLPVKRDHQPASQSPFKKNPKMRKLVMDFVYDLERKGLVSRCTNGEAVFVCNPLTLPKGPERYRFVCTFKDLNKNMIKDPYGMRTLDAVMSSLEGNTWFTTIDLVDGFFSLPLYPADRGFTAFHTPMGLYKWNVLPQGTAASPAIFQRVMDRWFAAYLWKNVIVWIDDILIFSKTFKEHLAALRSVFMVLRKYGLVASRRKLKLCMRSVRYLGFIFGVNGIRADPDKLSAVHDIPVPVSRKQVRQFLGFANFYRRFMPPNYARLVAPLTALTSVKTPFRWNARCQYAFNKVKLLLTSTPVLVHPDFSKPFHIHCDASGLGVGAVLSQYVDGAYRPIAFCSKKLLPHQAHWAPAQLEAYAIYHAVVEKWRYYLALSKCVVHSDPRNLIWLFDHSHKGMIGRWYAALSAFDLDITYVSGKSQLVADPLSRMFQNVRDGSYRPSSNPAIEGLISSAAGFLSTLVSASTSMRSSSSVSGRRSTLYGAPARVYGAPHQQSLPPHLQKLVQHFANKSTAKNIPHSVWASHQQRDPRLAEIYKYLAADVSTPIHKFSGRTRARAQSFRLVNGVLHYRSIREVGTYSLNEGWVIAVPRTMIPLVIRECHGDNEHGHGGELKTLLILRQRYHFRGMRKAVQQYIKACVPCKRAKSERTPGSTPLVPFISSTPFRAIAVDLYKPGSVTTQGFKYVLTVVDLCTRWVAFFPMKTKFASEVIATLCTLWIHTHGVPELILSDRGKEFLGVVTTVCQCLGIRQIRTTPYHPRTNGLCESQHKTLTVELKIRCTRPSAPEWSNILTEISFASNITPSRSADNLSPFNLVFGRSPRLSATDICFPVKAIPMPPNTPEHKQRFEKLQRKRIQGLQFRARESSHESKEDMRLQYDQKRAGSMKNKPPTKLKLGDIVSICTPATKLPKLNFQWSEPVHIVTQVTPTTVRTRDLTRQRGDSTASSSSDKDMDTVVNRKMTSLYPVPISFFLGAMVRKQFQGKWYTGTVDMVDTDEGETLWHVTYEDFDEEQLTLAELSRIITYHPLLDATSDLPVPDPGSFVWYSVQQQPRLGRVVSVDPTVSRPVVVEVYTPHGNTKQVYQSRFRREVDPSSGEAQVENITLHQIRLGFNKLSARGYLSPDDKARLRACLES